MKKGRFANSMPPFLLLLSFRGTKDLIYAMQVGEQMFTSGLTIAFNPFVLTEEGLMCAMQVGKYDIYSSPTLMPICLSNSEALKVLHSPCLIL